jgi:hypothetical protein
MVFSGSAISSQTDRYLSRYHGKKINTAIGTIGRIIVADLDGDGSVEIVAIRTQGKDFTILSSEGRIIRRFQMVFQDMVNLDQDSKIEILAFTRPTTHGKSLVLISNGGKILFRHRLLHMPDYKNSRPISSPFKIYYEDMDGDGSGDIILNSPQFGWDLVINSGGAEIEKKSMMKFLPIVKEDFDASSSPYVIRSSVDIRGDRFYLDLFGQDHLVYYRNSIPDKWYRDFPVYDDRTGKVLWVFRLDRDEAGDSLPGSFGAVETADLDGDGKREILLGANNRIYVVDGSGKPKRVIRNIFH